MKNATAFFLFCSFLFLVQQSTASDTLLQKAKQTKDPLEQAQQYFLYAQQLNATSTDTATLFLDSLIDTYANEKFAIGQARAMSLKAWFLLFQTQYEQAIKLGHQALEIQQELNDSLGLGQTYNRIGLSNIYFERYNEAINHLNKALNYFEQLHDTIRLDMVINNLGVIESEQKNFDAAIAYYKKSLQIRLKRKSYHWVAYSYFNIADAYRSLGQLDSALQYLQLSKKYFTQKTEHHSIPALASLGYAQTYFDRKEYDDALYWANKALADAQKTNHTEVIIGAEQLLAEIHFNNKNYKEAYLMAKAFQKSNNKLDSANNYASVAEIEAKYKTAEQERELSQLRFEQLNAKNREQKIWLISIAIGSFALLLIIILAWYYQRKLQQQQLQQAALNAKISETRMFALRAQMNPHFIFNCINTAQNFIMNSDKLAGYDYLAKFAALLRLVLENSSKKLVPLDDEISQIHYYLELEATRFAHKFQYQVNIDEELENGIYEIPGMLLQPLVENAIIHGLMNRDDNKGFINISMQKNDATVLCTISDNGVGRKAALDIKKRKNQHYTSTGMMNIQERLSILEQQFGNKIMFKIRDNTESDTQTGTIVQLWLPLN